MPGGCSASIPSPHAGRCEIPLASGQKLSWEQFCAISERFKRFQSDFEPSQSVSKDFIAASLRLRPLRLHRLSAAIRQGRIGPPGQGKAMKRMGSARRKRWSLLAAALGMTLLGWAPSAEARVRSVILNPPIPFPSVGSPYVLITGVATGEIDPSDPLDAVIQDIRLAPLDPKNLVLYSTQIAIVTPVDLSAGNHTMLVNIVNRGNTNVYDVGPDLFLLKQGFSVLFAGWQADLLPVAGLFFTMSAPVAHHRNGGTITDAARSEFTLSVPASTQNIVAGSSTDTAGYPTVSLDNRHDTITMRVHQDDPKLPILNTDWAYADCSTVPFPGAPDPQKVCLRNGFDTNHIYELVYTARDPIVMGLGLAAIRDVASFFRYATKTISATPTRSPERSSTRCCTASRRGPPYCGAISASASTKTRRTAKSSTECSLNAARAATRSIYASRSPADYREERSTPKRNTPVRTRRTRMATRWTCWPA
jgi:hypothetical protein